MSFAKCLADEIVGGIVLTKEIIAKPFQDGSPTEFRENSNISHVSDWASLNINVRKHTIQIVTTNNSAKGFIGDPHGFAVAEQPAVIGVGMDAVFVEEQFVDVADLCLGHVARLESVMVVVELYELWQ